MIVSDKKDDILKAKWKGRVLEVYKSNVKYEIQY